jgi:hypothetical protein
MIPLFEKANRSRSLFPVAKFVEIKVSVPLDTTVLSVIVSELSRE